MARSSMRRSPWCRSYVGPPGVRVPSRPIAPGTRSRYHAKSSPPRLCGGGDRAVARRAPRSTAPAEQRGGGRLVDHRRDAAHVVDLGARRRTARRSGRSARGPGPRRRPRRPRRASARCRPTSPVAGMTFLAGAGADHAPDQADAGARVEPAGQRARQLGDELAEGEGEVLGQVRARGVPAACRSAGPSSASAAPVSGPTRRPTWPTSMRGVAVQAEDVLDVVEGAGGDHLERAAGHDLLGRLEEQPDPARERRRARAPRPARARRRPARRCARRGRRRARRPSTVLRPRVVASVVDGQRVEVGAQRDERAGRRRRARRSGRSWAAAGRQAGLLEPVGDQGGGALLLPGQLGVGVQVAAERDQLVRRARRRRRRRGGGGRRARQARLPEGEGGPRTRRRGGPPLPAARPCGCGGPTSGRRRARSAPYRPRRAWPSGHLWLRPWGW